ncbi:actin-binding LIM protein 3-like isoform X2 [Salvelinus fontinalis]|uniref:actin-binding LIM protein 3-like isoform X2 n=1 Tax=Salvelinus fontinalis TaxID=8038 RepID=UPI00248632B1|nr:actin-binding LIM protein 3-like isoform X2 [Salvelinus fontinalis]
MSTSAYQQGSLGGERSSGPIRCQRCREACKGEVVRVQDTHFHVKCFTCTVCGCDLARSGFYQKSGEYICTSDYQRLYGTRCDRCDGFITGEVVSALGRTYHPTCFVCSVCRKPFPIGDRVTFSGKDCVCQQCSHTLVTSNEPIKIHGPSHCSGCGEDIKQGQSLLALEKQWHVSCFKCQTCNMVLTGEYISKDNVPYCESDYHAQFGIKCETCSRYISGQVLEAGGKHYHPTCARCARCHMMFTEGEEMYLHGGEVWHPLCKQAARSERRLRHRRLSETSISPPGSSIGSPSRVICARVENVMPGYKDLAALPKLKAIYEVQPPDLISSYQPQNHPTISSYQQQHHSTISSYQQQHRPTISSYQPQHHPTISSYQPQNHPTISSYQQQHHSTISSYQQQHHPTISSYQPQHHPTISSYQPQHHPTISSYQPQHHPTISSYQPQNHPTISSSQPYPRYSSDDIEAFSYGESLGTLYSQVSNRVVLQSPGTLYSQVSKRVVFQSLGTLYSQVSNRVVLESLGTLYSQVSNRVVLQSLGTLYSQVSNRVVLRSPGTLYSQVSNRVVLQSLGTLYSQVSNRVVLESLGTLYSQVSNRVVLQSLGTLYSQVSNRVVLQSPGTLYSQVSNRVVLQSLGTLYSQVSNRVVLQSLGTLYSQVSNRVVLQSLGTLYSQVGNRVVLESLGTLYSQKLYDSVDMKQRQGSSPSYMDSPSFSRQAMSPITPCSPQHYGHPVLAAGSESGRSSPYYGSLEGRPSSSTTNHAPKHFHVPDNLPATKSRTSEDLITSSRLSTYSPEPYTQSESDTYPYPRSPKGIPYTLHPTLQNPTHSQSDSYPYPRSPKGIPYTLHLTPYSPEPYTQSV